MELVHEIAPEQRLAVSLAPSRARDRYAALFALDRRLGNVVARMREPIAVQLRLAWWREVMDSRQRVSSDPEIAAICAAWVGHLHCLRPMIDGWEELVARPPDVVAAAAGRASPFLELARETISEPSRLEQAHEATMRWLLVDLALRSSDKDVATAARQAARTLTATAVPLPRALRPLALLDGLARRALRQGGSALLGDRLSPLAALRLGIFGR